AGSGSIRDLVTRPGSWSRPAVSPDGRMVAFAGYEPSGRSHTVGDLWVVSTTGENMRKISGDFDRDPVNLHWAPDSARLYFAAQDRGSENVYAAVASGGVTKVTTGAHILTLDSTSRNMVAAGTLADPEHPQDVVRYSLAERGDPVKLTDVNGDVLQSKQIAKTEEI